MIKRNMIISWFIYLFIFTGLTMPVHAHHSFAMFDQTKLSTVEGIIKRVDWRNPHAYFEVSVGQGSNITTYTFECSSPNELLRWGWKPKSVKPGDKVTVQFFPLRSEKKSGGMVYSLTQANGQVFKAN